MRSKRVIKNNKKPSVRYLKREAAMKIRGTSDIYKRLERKDRKCLKCDRVFHSMGAQNRMCDDCRRATEHFAISALALSSLKNR